MLVETKAVVQMALLFGGTWMVNTVVFAAILVMSLPGNLFAGRVQPASGWSRTTSGCSRRWRWGWRPAGRVPGHEPDRADLGRRAPGVRADRVRRGDLRHDVPADDASRTGCSGRTSPGRWWAGWPRTLGGAGLPVAVVRRGRVLPAVGGVREPGSARRRGRTERIMPVSSHGRPRRKARVVRTARCVAHPAARGSTAEPRRMPCVRVRVSRPTCPFPGVRVATSRSDLWHRICVTDRESIPRLVPEPGRDPNPSRDHRSGECSSCPR